MEKIRRLHMIVKLFMIYCIILVLAYILMCTAYALPTQNMRRHVAESMEVFEMEGEYPRLITGHYNMLLKTVSGLPKDQSVNLNSQLDNFTDALMLLEASFEGAYNPFVACVRNEHAVINEKSPVETLVMIYSDKNLEYETATYGRYWHGYEIFLKPLLLLFNYQEIRYIIMALQIGLLALVIAMYAYKHMIKEIVPLVCTYLFLNPAALSLSLQFNLCWVLTLIQLAIFIYFDKIYEDDRHLWVYHFFIVGCLICFFDFLTYPLVTFGITASYLTFKYCETLRDGMSSLIKTGVAWGTGYALMWAGKWIIGSIVSGENIIVEAMLQVKARVSYETVGGVISYFDVLAKNIYVGFGYLFCMAVAVMICVVIAFLYKVRFWEKSIIFLICAFIPCAWYMIAANHSYVHAFFTYRELSITIYALCSLSVMLICEVRKKKIL